MRITVGDIKDEQAFLFDIEKKITELKNAEKEKQQKIKEKLEEKDDYNYNSVNIYLK